MKRERPGSRDAAKGPDKATGRSSRAPSAKPVDPPKERRRAPRPASASQQEAADQAASRSAARRKPVERPKAAAAPSRKPAASATRAPAAKPAKPTAAAKASPAPKTDRRAAAPAKAAPGRRKTADRRTTPRAARTAPPTAPAAKAAKAPAAAAKPVAKGRAVARPTASASRTARGRKAGVAEPLLTVAPDLTDEERATSAKFSSPDIAPVFEDERFVFPESYGQNRVRLLVKDPQWLFAHWDVDPSVFAGLRSELGERAAALSRLTLKVTDPDHGGGMVIHLPEHSRSWYLRADRARRTYLAELGLTLPSGEYRPLAWSNMASAPLAGVSPRPARRRAVYAAPRVGAVRVTDWIEGDNDFDWDALDAGPAPEPAAGPGPWRPAPGDARQPHHHDGHEPAGHEEPKGGASDVHRR